MNPGGASAGSTSGDMKRLSSTFAVSRSDRAMPSAAATPSTTESTIVQSATFRLLIKANWSCQAFHSSTYQRNEKPGGGKRSEKPLVNDTTSTTTVGAARSTSVSRAIPTMTKRKLNAS